MFVLIDLKEYILTLNNNKTDVRILDLDLKWGWSESYWGWIDRKKNYWKYVFTFFRGTLIFEIKLKNNFKARKVVGQNKIV